MRSSFILCNGDYLFIVLIVDRLIQFFFKKNSTCNLTANSNENTTGLVHYYVFFVFFASANILITILTIKPVWVWRSAPAILVKARGDDVQVTSRVLWNCEKPDEISVRGCLNRKADLRRLGKSFSCKGRGIEFEPVREHLS